MEDEALVQLVVGAAPAGSAVDAIDLTNMSSGSEAELLGDDGLPSPTLNQVCAWVCAASLRLRSEEQRPAPLRHITL